MPGRFPATTAAMRPPWAAPRPPVPEPVPEPDAASSLALTDKDKTVVPLGGAIGDVVVAAGGRYLLVHLRGRRQVAVFDVAAGKVLRYLPVAEEQARIAAGASKMLVVLPANDILQRWDLTTLRRDTTVPLPFGGVVKAVSMGSASRGPALVYWAVGTGELDQARFSFLDVDTLKPADQPGIERIGHYGNYRDHVHLRAAADGRLFGMWCTSHSPSGLATLTLRGGEPRAHYEHNDVGHVVPDPDGKTLYTAAGQFTPECKPLLGESLRPGQRRFVLPARQGDYYLVLRPGAGRAPVDLYRVGDPRPLLRLSGVEVAVGEERFVRHDFTDDKRVHFFAAAQALVTIPPGNDRLVLHRLDVEAALKKAAVDYLLITSQPPPAVKKGTTYSYQLGGRSRQGEVKFQLEAGPEGMKLEPGGKLTWPVPADHPDGDSESVILLASDTSGQQAFQTFRVSVRSADPPRPGEPPPAEDREPPGEPPPQPAAESGRAPAALEKARVERLLPAAIADLCVGGGGRFLILHLPSVRKLAVFDAAAAKVVHFLPVDGDTVHFAAGMDKLLVVTEKKTVERWSLATFKKEDSAPLPVQGAVHSAAMGAASNGPLVLGGPEMRGPNNLPLRFFDVGSLRELAFDVRERRGGFGMVGIHPQYPHVMRMSADGRVLGMWNVGLSPSGLMTVTLDGPTLQAFHEHTSVGHIVPGPDGKTVFTAMGLYTAECKALGAEGRQLRYCLPAQRGSYYMATPVVEPDPRNWANAGERRQPLSLYLLGESRPICALPEAEVLPQERSPAGGLAQDTCFHLLPDAKLLVVIPPGRDRLVLHRFDPDEALQKSDIDYLFVTSLPQPSARCGETYTYPLALKCKAKGVRYRVELGPPGLQVARGGKVTWAVPAAFDSSEAVVVLNIRSDSGQECYHTFKIHVTR
jgi:hypothetical protein